MTKEEFKKRAKQLFREHGLLIRKKNKKVKRSNGIYDRYINPIITAEHTPVFWRYDLDQKTNPFLMERLGVNATFNAGAMEFNGKIVVLARVEGLDRKS